MTEKQPAAAGLAPQAEDIFRGLWTSLFYTPQAPPKSVLVCSCHRREGSTTVACGLALAGAGASPSDSGAEEAAPMGGTAGARASHPTRPVVLVDFNLRNPAVNDTLNIANGTGVSDVLVGRKELGEALQRIGPGQLDVLTAGGECGRVLEVLRADRVRALLKDLENRYDHVIIDSAPVNMYPDARVLAESVGCVVLVARHRQTHREALLQARKQLEHGGGKVAGVVLNRRTYPVPAFVYRRV